MRKVYIDNIRWITVVLVVIYHVIYMFNGVETAGVIGPFAEMQYQDVYQYMVYPWFMLLLFVVSGMCVRFCLEGCSDKEFLKKRTQKLLVPSTIGLFVFQWILGYYNMMLSGVFTDTMQEIPGVIRYIIMVVSGIGPLWYLQMLWLFSVILAVIRKLEKDRLYRKCEKIPVWLLLLFTIVVYGAAQILNMPVIVVYRFGIYGFGFFAGYFCLSHDSVVEKLQKYWLPLAVAAVVLGILFVVRYWGAPYAEHSVLDKPLCNAFAWISVLAILAGMSRFGNFKNGFTLFMQKESWGIYIFHYLPLAMCAYYLHAYAKNLPVAAVYILTGAAAFLGAMGLYRIMSRIPVICWCVLGIRRKER